MKTLILLVPVIGLSIQNNEIDILIHYLGVKNASPAEDRPGCIYEGVLNDSEKDALKDYIYQSISKIDVTILFIEYEGDSICTGNHITLSKKQLDKKQKSRLYSIECYYVIERSKILSIFKFL